MSEIQAAREVPDAVHPEEAEESEYWASRAVRREALHAFELWLEANDPEVWYDAESSTLVVSYDITLTQH